ncbi:MAG TPA: hypothetical protein VF172_00240 [Nitrososphaera sp.]|jgi:hypothetical protein
MRESLLAFVEERGIDDGEDRRFQCNICGSKAEFVVQLEVARGARYNVFRVRQTPFYLCKAHEHIYKKMQRSIELKDYFTETIREHK